MIPHTCCANTPRADVAGRRARGCGNGMNLRATNENGFNQDQVEWQWWEKSCFELNSVHFDGSGAKQTMARASCELLSLACYLMEAQYHCKLHFTSTNVDFIFSNLFTLPPSPSSHSSPRSRCFMRNSNERTHTQTHSPRLIAKVFCVHLKLREMEVCAVRVCCMCVHCALYTRRCDSIPSNHPHSYPFAYPFILIHIVECRSAAAESVTFSLWMCKELFCIATHIVETNTFFMIPSTWVLACEPLCVRCTCLCVCVCVWLMLSLDLPHKS